MLSIASSWGHLYAPSSWPRNILPLSLFQPADQKFGRCCVCFFVGSWLGVGHFEGSSWFIFVFTQRYERVGDLRIHSSAFWVTGFAEGLRVDSLHPINGWDPEGPWLGYIMIYHHVQCPAPRKAGYLRFYIATEEATSTLVPSNSGPSLRLSFLAAAARLSSAWDSWETWKLMTYLILFPSFPPKKLYLKYYNVNPGFC